MDWLKAAGNRDEVRLQKSERAVAVDVVRMTASFGSRPTRLAGLFW